MDALAPIRPFRPTPAWLVLVSLAVTGLLWLSDWLGWPAWHKRYAVLAARAAVGAAAAETNVVSLRKPPTRGGS